MKQLLLFSMIGLFFFSCNTDEKKNRKSIVNLEVISEKVEEPKKVEETDIGELTDNKHKRYNLERYKPEINQFGNRTVLNTDVDNTVQLEKNSFSFLFYTPPNEPESKNHYGVKVAAFVDRDLFGQTQADTSIEEIQYFAIGTSLASKSKHHLHIDHIAHNYIFYNNSNFYRAMLMQKLPDGVHKIKWDIDRLFIDDGRLDVTLKETSIKTIYLIVFQDYNRNEIVDKGEFIKVILELR
ncbi:hypothetical protein [Aquimarina sp. MMG016]|uniref:hypothetical protein n=1 Tax=Aquimarina sp. MMG016 TaxID=2822690 RepID=UPI001B3A01F1|nr:hypothetical protein [Aquimarina sp. MMG016]MBQ4819628.1 hypothetical protein [Aquimarina sp. MMG016]